jgi:hypothetical protein
LQRQGKQPPDEKFSGNQRNPRFRAPGLHPDKNAADEQGRYRNQERIQTDAVFVE